MSRSNRARTLSRCIPFAFAGLASHAEDLRYDAQVAWFHAGAIEMTLQEDASRYELSGAVTTAGATNRLFKWRGQFAARGRFIEGFPTTEAYFLLEDEGDKREVLLAFGDRTTILATGDDAEELPAPPGSDLMSVIFLAPHCFAETTVNDGEDAYRIVPERSTERNLRQRAGYYSGPAKRCDYRFRYVDGSTRRVSIWVADTASRFPVRIQIRVPFLPDGILRLRVNDPAP